MITAIYFGLVGILFFIISLHVISARKSNQISLGTGANSEIAHLVAAHSNFASYVPFYFLGLYLLEDRGFHSVGIHVLGSLFVLGRLMHYLGLKTVKNNFKLRINGMLLTLFPLIILCVLNILYATNLLTN